MTKKCNSCNIEKKLDDFSTNRTKSHGKESTCKKCRRNYAKQWYQENKELHKKRVSKVRNRYKGNRQKIYDYLLDHPCVDCGETRPACLEFDHVRDSKSFSVSQAINSYSWKRVVEEIDKCDVRCANCHRIKTAKDFGWYRGLILRGSSNGGSPAS